MARIPLVTEFKPKGIDHAIREFKRLETTGQKFSFAMKKAFLPATAALAGLGAAATKFVNAGEEAATSNARIRQVADSMGLFGEASEEVTKKLVKQSEATARLTGVDQNMIKQGQATLLTFGNIAKSADEMGGAFDRATQLTIDLAAAGFGSVETNAIQLGKALNDPITGLSALSRSGVTFTETEKELIKTLVESGKQFEAQDMILKAIEKQVGGTAEATANSTDKLKVGFSQMSEQIGMALLPLVEAVVPVLIELFTFMGEHTNVVIGLGIAIGTVAAAIVATNVAMKAYKAAVLVAKGVTLAFNAVLALNPIVLIVAAVAALVAAFIVLQKKFDIIGLAIRGMKVAFDRAWDGIRWVINKIIDGLNMVIELLNAIPFVDIPELSHLGESAEEAAGRMGEFVGQALAAKDAVDAGREPMGRFETSISKVRKEGDKLETTLGDVDKALDPLNEGIETATTRLDRFFDTLDQKEATDKFIEDLQEIQKRLSGAAEGSEEFEDAQNEAYEALRTLREERDDLSDSFFEALKINIDTGDLERAWTIMTQLVDLGGRIEVPSTYEDMFNMGFGVPNLQQDLFTGRQDGMVGDQYNIIMPPGTTPQDVLESQRQTNARRGVANYEVAGAGVL
jgi:uncharacterized coiled-coil DUF342 family protein